MKTKFIVLFSCILFSITTYAQKEAAIWYFGYNAGLSFLTDPPSAIEDGNKIYTKEGCSTICDPDGNLMFYSDGTHIWNKNHDLMKDSSGHNVDYLEGSPSSAQCGLVVPKPKNPKIFYVFSIREYGYGPPYYSVVDFSSNPLGVVTQANISLYPSGTNASEVISATLSSNGEDIWIITKEAGANIYVLHKVTKNGIDTTPVKKQRIGKNNMGRNVGIMKFSGDGRMLAVSAEYGNSVQIFNFDNQTGDITVLNDQLQLIDAYGLSFSPNSKLLYIAQEARDKGINSKILQIDLTQQASTLHRNISNVRTVVTEERISIGDMQLGIDGKIYVAKQGQEYLSVIENPNVKGTGCNYIKLGVDLNPSGYVKNCTARHVLYPGCKRLSRVGLPNFIQSLFIEQFIVGNRCIGNSTNLSAKTSGFNTYELDFGDGTTVETGNIPASGEVKTTHEYNSTGIYTARLTLTANTGKSITKETKFEVYNGTAITFNENDICVGATPITLSASPSGGSYSGMGVSGNNFNPSIAGIGTHNITYRYTNDNACESTKTININVVGLPDAGMDGTIYLCQGTSPTDADLQDAIKYETAGGTWSPSPTAGVTTYTYTVRGTGTCLGYADTSTVTVNYIAPPTAGTNGVLELCLGEIASIKELQDAITGEDAGGTWSPSPTAGVTTYTYTLNGKGVCAGSSDTSTVTVSYKAKPKAGNNGTISLCEGAIPTITQLNNEITGEDSGGTWSPATPAAGITTYTYTISSIPCNMSVFSVVKIIYKKRPNAGIDGIVNLCVGEKPTIAQLQSAITREDSGGTWSPAIPAIGVTKYTYTVTGTGICSSSSDNSNVIINYQSQPNAGNDGILNLCSGDIPTIAQLYDALSDEDLGGTWSPATPVAGVTRYTYTVNAKSPCVGSDSATVSLRYQAKPPDAGSDGTLILCKGTIPTIAQLNDAIVGEDTGGTWYPVPSIGVSNYTYTFKGNGACNDDVANVTIIYQKQANAGGDSSLTICEGSTPTLLQLQNAITGEDAGGTWSPSIAPGIKLYTYTVKKTAPCTSDNTSKVTIIYSKKPNAGKDGNLILCDNQTATIKQLQEAITGEEIGGTWSPSPTEGVTTYTYTIGKDNCDTSTSKVNVTILEPLSLNIEKQVFICPTQNSVDLAVKNPNPNYVYKWYDSGNNLIATGVKIVTSNTGIYTVEASIKQHNSCKLKKSIAVISEKSPPIVKNTDLAISESNNGIGQVLTIEMKNATDYYLFSVDNSETSNFVSKTVFNVSYGVHRLYVKDKRNCFKTYYIDFVVVEGTDFFTPNGDGISDLWKMKGLNLSYFKEFTLSILNRHGQILKLFRDDFKGWDGKDTNGKQMLPDDYWYKLETIDKYGIKLVKTGHFSLINDNN